MSVSFFGTVLITLVLSILFGFRTIETGTDTYAYYTWYESLGRLYTTRDFEPAFTILGRAVHWFTDDASMFFTFIAALTFYYISKAGSLSSGMLVVPLLLVMSVSFISGVDLVSNGIRNGLALAIATYALLKYLDGGGNTKYIACVGVASMIHASCVLFFVVIFINRIISDRHLKLAFYFYLLIFSMESLNVFNFVFETIASIGIGSHIISRILAFKYQESDMFNGYIKYYFFVITLIPYLLFEFKYYVNKKLAIIHYALLIPYALIFSAPSSYRFSYLSFYILVIIIAQSVFYSQSRTKRVAIYAMILAMIFITYTTKTSMSYGNLLFV